VDNSARHTIGAWHRKKFAGLVISGAATGTWELRDRQLQRQLKSSNRDYHTMLPTIRSRAARQILRGVYYSARRSYAFSANDNQEINTSKPPKEVQNVSETNEMPMDAVHTSAALQESVEHAEKMRVTQAPNRDQVWSRSQNPRAKAMSGPRFEQTIMELQVAKQLNSIAYVASMNPNDRYSLRLKPLSL
jgi:hypothetical protein